ncbi:MAG: hypothetical protein JNK79_00205 [Chitinophagaceae bacterium]|nr:hypothetical protein [Chitinophagaceae bacterium]
MKKYIISGALFLFVAMFLTINGKSQKVDACGLITKSEVQSAIGTSVLAPLKDEGKLGDIPFSHCTFKKNSDLIALLLTIYTYKSKDEVKKLFESSMKQVGGTEPVSGLGDGAYWWKSKNSLFVIKDKYMVTILLGPETGELKAAKSIGEIVVKKMP